MSTSYFHDAFRRLAQEGSANWLRLVRINQLQSGNAYEAQFVQITPEGASQPTGDAPISVINLAEPADADGQLPGGIDTVAMDVEGRWIIFVRPATAASFPAKVVESLSAGLYTVRQQVLSDEGEFEDAPGAADLEASNLAELSLGPGGAMDVGAIVIIHALSTPQSLADLRYVFDHPVYAKYMD